MRAIADGDILNRLHISTSSGYLIYIENCFVSPSDTNIYDTMYCSLYPI